jgi:hypothetical protein
MAARSVVHKAHHWMIDTLPKNDFYHAMCKTCGAEKYFPEEEPRFRFRIRRHSSPPSAIEPLHPAASGKP